MDDLLTDNLVVNLCIGSLSIINLSVN